MPKHHKVYIVFDNMALPAYTINNCRDFQLPDPEFKLTGTSFVVTFRRSKLTEEYLKELGLNER